MTTYRGFGIISYDIPGGAHTAYTASAYYSSWRNVVQFRGFSEMYSIDTPGDPFEVWLMKRWRYQANLPEQPLVAPRTVPIYEPSSIPVDLLGRITGPTDVDAWARSAIRRENFVPLEDEHSQRLIDSLEARAHNEFIADWVRLAHWYLRKQEEILKRLDRIEQGNVQDVLADDKSKSRFGELL